MSALIIHESSAVEYCNHCLKSYSYILVEQISKKTADVSAMAENSTKSESRKKKTKQVWNSNKEFFFFFVAKYSLNHLL